MLLFHLLNRLIDMKKIIFIATILTILAGCAVGPKYSLPETKKPEAYAQAAKADSIASDSVTNLKWWDVYKDSALVNLIDTAIIKNLDLKSALARVEEAKAILGFNQANMFPFFDYAGRARASDFGNIATGAGVAFPTNSFSVLGNVSWEIDLWGKDRKSVV